MRSMRLLDARDDPKRPVTASAKLNIDGEYLASQPLAVTRDGEDDGVVARAKAAVAYRPSRHRRALRDDDLEQASLGSWRIELEELIGRGDETAHAQQIRERIHDADEE